MARGRARPECGCTPPRVMLCWASNSGVTVTGSGTTAEEAVVITVMSIVAWDRTQHGWKAIVESGERGSFSGKLRRFSSQIARRNGGQPMGLKSDPRQNRSGSATEAAGNRTKIESRGQGGMSLIRDTVGYTLRCPPMHAGMAELADAADSKSADLRVMGVRPPLPAPTK